MSVKYKFDKGHWKVFVNYHNRRANHRVEPNTEERAIQAAEEVRLVLKHYGEDALAMWEKELHPEPPAKKNKTLLGEFGDEWIEKILPAANRATKTRECYATHWKNHIKPALGAMPLASLDYESIRNFLIQKSNETYSSGRFRKADRPKEFKPTKPFAKLRQIKYSRNTVRLIAMTLKAVLTEAALVKAIAEIPFTEKLSQFYGVPKDAQVVEEDQIYTAEELYQIEDEALKNRALYSPDFYEWILGLSRTGMRIGESRSVREEDFDAEQKTFRVKHNMPGTSTIERKETKTPSGRRLIEIGDELILALKTMLARRKAEDLKEGRRDPGGRQRRLFPLRYERFYQDWRRLHNRLGLRYRNPHSLRHTYASIMLARGANLGWISRQLGHKNTMITSTVYVHFIKGGRPNQAGLLDRGKMPAPAESASFLHSFQKTEV